MKPKYQITPEGVVINDRLCKWVGEEEAFDRYLGFLQLENETFKILSDALGAFRSGHASYQDGYARLKNLIGQQRYSDFQYKDKLSSLDEWFSDSVARDFGDDWPEFELFVRSIVEFREGITELRSSDDGGTARAGLDSRERPTSREVRSETEDGSEEGGGLGESGGVDD